jgi:hypothetical protein
MLHENRANGSTAMIKGTRQVRVAACQTRETAETDKA